jgi:hypothetical protein
VLFEFIVLCHYELETRNSKLETFLVDDGDNELPLLKPLSAQVGEG